MGGESKRLTNSETAGVFALIAVYFIMIALGALFTVGAWVIGVYTLLSWVFN